MINEILAERRVDYIGPLPQSIQDYTRFAIGLVASGKQQAAGSELVKLMTSPDTSWSCAGWVLSHSDRVAKR